MELKRILLVKITELILFDLDHEKSLKYDRRCLRASPRHGGIGFFIFLSPICRGASLGGAAGNLVV
jgi:hypothetical protein